MAAAGEPVRLVTDVGDNELVLRGLFSVSDDGVLVYSSGATTEQLAWFDRAGNMEPVVGSPGPVRDPALSPSETQVAFAGRSAGAGLADIWLLDIAREVPLRVTFDPSFHFFPVWSPDGLQILFSANRDGRSQIYVTELDDSNSKDAELVFASDDDSYASDWSQDGRFVAYSTGSMAGGDLWAIPLTGERQPIEVATSDFIEGDGRFSPDGNWIAFVSNESGRSEVYVQAFPNGGRKVRISVDGGSQPRWRGDGRELFYLDAKRRLLAVPVDVDSAGVVTGQPEVLFQTRPDVAGYADYDVTQDGERFLMVASSGVVRSYAFHIDWNWLPDTRR